MHCCGRKQGFQGLCCMRLLCYRAGRHPRGEMVSNGNAARAVGCHFEDRDQRECFPFGEDMRVRVCRIRQWMSLGCEPL